MGFTASGRQVRSRHRGPYVESLLSKPDNAAGNGEDAAMDVDDEDEEPVNRGRGRPRRSLQPNGVRKHVREKSMREFEGSEASNDDSEDTPSSNEWNGEDEKEVDEKDDDDDDDLEMSEDEVVDEEDGEDEDARLVVRLKYSKGQSKSPRATDQVNGTILAQKADEENSSFGPQQSGLKGGVIQDRLELTEQSNPKLSGSQAGLHNDVSTSKKADPDSLTADHDDVDSRPSSSPAPQPTPFQPQTFLYQDKQI